MGGDGAGAFGATFASYSEAVRIGGALALVIDELSMPDRECVSERPLGMLQPWGSLWLAGAALMVMAMLR